MLPVVANLGDCVLGIMGDPFPGSFDVLLPNVYEVCHLVENVCGMFDLPVFDFLLHVHKEERKELGNRRE